MALAFGNYVKSGPQSPKSIAGTCGLDPSMPFRPSDLQAIHSSWGRSLNRTPRTQKPRCSKEYTEKLVGAAGLFAGVSGNGDRPQAGGLWLRPVLARAAGSSEDEMTVGGCRASRASGGFGLGALGTRPRVPTDAYKDLLTRTSPRRDLKIISKICYLESQ